MTTKYPCPVKSCENYGRRCYDHCNHCGALIRWRPLLLDKEIAYSGPKPLDMDDKVHRCMTGGTKDGQYYDTRRIKSCWITKHYNNLMLLGYCPDPDCYFAKIERDKNPEVFAEWNKKHAEWLQKWPCDIIIRGEMI
jgi:hypothetical protein